MKPGIRRCPPSKSTGCGEPSLREVSLPIAGLTVIAAAGVAAIAPVVVRTRHRLTVADHRFDRAVAPSF